MMKLFTLITITFMFNTSFATLSNLNSMSTPFKLPPLPYKASSLEKGIDAQTMSIHHSKHHQSYVDNANKALAGKKFKIVELLKSASKQTPAIRNNVGGHWNHSFFWTILSGEAENNKMPARLKKEIEKQWETVEKFQAEFENEGAAQFGSGWVWLIRTPDGLKITTTPNQDNPLMDAVAVRGWPVLGADVWEHAYYLKYQNKRPEYLKNFWSIVNWKAVDKYDQEAMKAKLP